MNTDSKSNGFPYVLLLSLFFGTSLVSSRFALREITSFTFIGLRMLISTCAFIVVFTFSKQYHWPTSKRIWKHGFVLGIIGTAVPMTAFITSLNYLSSGVSAIIGTTSPAITVLLASFLLKDEDLTRRKIYGIVLALGGALLLTLLGESGLNTDEAVNPLGYMLVFVANISSSFGVIYARKYVRDLSAFEITSVRAFVAMLVTLPIAYLFIGIDLSALTRVGVTAILYSSLISSFAGFILSLYIINQFGVATSVMTNYMVPIVTAIGGVLLLDERVTVGMVGGMLIIIAGIAIINMKKADPNRQTFLRFRRWWVQ
jgi:drug/metabolite transporter (DMT)-like permease